MLSVKSFFHHKFEIMVIYDFFLGVEMKTTEVEGNSDHVLIQPEDIQLSTVDDLTPTHIVKVRICFL